MLASSPRVTPKVPSPDCYQHLELNGGHLLGMTRLSKRFFCRSFQSGMFHRQLHSKWTPQGCWQRCVTAQAASAHSRYVCASRQAGEWPLELSLAERATHIDGRMPGELHKVCDLVLVLPPHHHHVHLPRINICGQMKRRFEAWTPLCVTCSRAAAASILTKEARDAIPLKCSGRIELGTGHNVLTPWSVGCEDTERALCMIGPQAP